MLLFTESFQWLAAGTTSTTLENLLAEKYLSANADGGAQKGNIISEVEGQSLHFGSSTADHITIEVPDTPTTFTLGLRFKKVGEVTSNTIDFITIDDGSSVEQMTVNWDENHTLMIKRGSSVLKRVTLTNVRFNEWHHFEMQATISNTVGTVEIRIDEVVVINETGLDNSNAGTPECGEIRIGQPSTSSSGGWSVRDIYLMDDSGSTNNDFIGMSKFNHLLLPNADGDDEDWTLSAGTDSFALIDEVNNDADTSYIESSTATDQTLVNYEATGSETNILGIMVASTVRLDSAGSEDFQHVVKQNGTELDSASITVDVTTYEQKYTVFETNPDTTNAWTASELDSVQAGVEYQ